MRKSLNKWMLGLGLFLGMLLPMSCSNTAKADPLQEPVMLQQINLADPKVQGLMERIKYVYQLRFGSSADFPKDLTIVRWLGKDGDLMTRICECYGITNALLGVPGDVLVQIMEKTGNWTNEFVLAHELVHVLHSADGRWSAKDRDAFEEEADGIAYQVIWQMRVEGIYSIFAEDGKDAVRKSP